MNPLKILKSLGVNIYKSQTPYYGINLRTEALPASVTLNLSFLIVIEIYLRVPTIFQKVFLNLFRLKPLHSAWSRDYGMGIIKDESGWGYDCWFQLYLGTNYAGEGWSFSKSLTELIYGELSYNREVKDVLKTSIFIPGIGEYSDDTYEIKINEEIVSYIWKRFNKKIITSVYEINCEQGVPHRRKFGSQDRRYSYCCPAASYYEAIDRFIKNIQDVRRRSIIQ